MAPKGGPADRRRIVTRVQTGVRIEKRILLVLKALAGTLDLTLGDLLEGIVLHAFAGKPPFSQETLSRIHALEQVYGLDLSAEDSHLLREATRGGATARKR
ncbi:MAG: hypothetical protein ACJ79H_16500 [Myxococcales bacterium]